jgi:hypothetical protein
MANLGISFSPFNDQQPELNPRNGQAPTPQEAIRVLSLRVPRTVGAGSPVPQALLGAPGGAAFGGGMPGIMGGAPGAPGGMSLEQLLAMLFGQRIGTQPVGPREVAPPFDNTYRFNAPPDYAPAPEPPPAQAPNPRYSFGEKPPDNGQGAGYTPPAPDMNAIAPRRSDRQA